MTSVNSVLSYAGVGALPFGGVGDSGFGRIHGDDGLREFARAKAITRPRFPTPLDVTRFDRKPWSIRLLGLVLRAAYGRAPRRRPNQP
jgi:aldehyde dehydrogenase (NAD+)